MDFVGGHPHCTRFSGLTSAFVPITLSVIQGSATGSAFFDVSAVDLTGNLRAKCTDDTYLIVPKHVRSGAPKLDSIETWAKTNNVALNCSKIIETVITDGDEASLLNLSLYILLQWGRLTQNFR